MPTTATLLYAKSLPEELKWSVVSAVRGNLTEKAEIKGGWLYRTTVVHDDGQFACAMTFVPEAR